MPFLKNLTDPPAPPPPPPPVVTIAEMTLRDYFAISIIPLLTTILPDTRRRSNTPLADDMIRAYDLADQMLLAREGKLPPTGR